MPGLFDRRADENTSEGDSEEPKHQDEVHDIDAAMEELAREDAFVAIQDGHLGESDATWVSNCPAELETKERDHLVIVKRILMSSHAMGQD